LGYRTDTDSHAQACITELSQVGLDPADPYPTGYRLSDTWPTMPSWADSAAPGILAVAFEIPRSPVDVDLATVRHVRGCGCGCGEASCDVAAQAATMDAITTYPAQTRHKDLRRRPFIPYPGSAGTASRSVTAGGGDLRRVLPSVVSVSGSATWCWASKRRWPG